MCFNTIILIVIMNKSCAKFLADLKDSCFIQALAATHSLQRVLMQLKDIPPTAHKCDKLYKRADCPHAIKQKKYVHFHFVKIYHNILTITKVCVCLFSMCLVKGNRDNICPWKPGCLSLPPATILASHGALLSQAWGHEGHREMGGVEVE